MSRRTLQLAPIGPWPDRPALGPPRDSARGTRSLRIKKIATFGLLLAYLPYDTGGGGGGELPSPGDTRHSGFAAAQVNDDYNATSMTGAAGQLEALLITSNTTGLVRFFHAEVRLTDDEIARVAGVKGQSVRRWRSTVANGTPRSKERLDDLRSIVLLLLQSGVLYSDEIGRWLRARNSDLGFGRPTVLLGQGQFEAVRRAADLHVARLEGRVLAPGGTLDQEIEQLFDSAAHNAPEDEDREYVSHGHGRDDADGGNSGS